MTVQVIDTGKGLPSHEDETEEEASEGLGLSLIKNLIGDLGGQFVLRRSADDSKTIAEVRFPLTGRQGQVAVRNGDRESHQSITSDDGM